MPFGRAQDRKNRAGRKYSHRCWRSRRADQTQQVLALRIPGRNRINIIISSEAIAARWLPSVDLMKISLVMISSFFWVSPARSRCRTAQHADQRALVTSCAICLQRSTMSLIRPVKIAARTRNGALLFDDELDQTFAHNFFFIRFSIGVIYRFYRLLHTAIWSTR